MDSGSTALNPNGEVVEEQSPLFLASLAKGLTVVRSFNQRRPDMSLKEISQVNNLTMGSTQRIAHTLEVMGILTRDPRSKRYRLGVGSLNYGSQYLQTELLLERANAPLLELSQYFGETVNLHVPGGLDIVLVSRVQSRRHIPIYLPIGQRLPMYCTASGRALLSSFESDTDILPYLGKEPRVKYTNNTVISDKELLQKIDQVRKEGYSLSNGEYFLGDLNIAAPIFDELGTAVAAVNISVPAQRWSLQRIQEELAPMVIRTARALSCSR